MKINTRLLGETDSDIEIAAEIIRKGDLVAFPTETVYGLGANALDEEAVKKVYIAKGRPSDNPMIVHIYKKEQLYELAENVTQDMLKLANCFWPGPLTMVVRAKSIIPKVTTGGLDTVAVRLPLHTTARALIEKAGVPIAAPSANLSGKPSPTEARDVIEDMDGKIHGIITGAGCNIGIESTVIDMTGKIPLILRPGYITLKDIAETLGKEVLLDKHLTIKPDISHREGLNEFTYEEKPKSPGMKYRHYAPNAEMIIYEGDKEKVLETITAEKIRRMEQGQKVEVILFNAVSPKEAARLFFAKLRECDRKGVDVILATAVQDEGIGFAVMNRMIKSAGYNVISVK